MINVAAMVAQLKLNAQQFTAGINTAKKQATLFSNAMVMGQKGLTGFRKRLTMLRSPLVQLGALFGGLGLAQVVRDTVTAGASFEQMMTIVKGVSGATGEMYERLTKAAEHYGATTEWTAAQAAESLKFLSMAGFTAEQSLEALGGTLDLATAGQIGLGESADIATNILTQMGLEIRELARVNDALVTVQASANTTIREAADAWIYAGTKARTFHVEVEELAAYIGILANSGIKATMAGTTLRQSMIKLLSPTKEAEEILRKYNIRVEDGAGGVRSFTDILYDLSDSQLSAIEITELFGARAGNIEIILREGSDALREYIKEIKAGEGASKSLADLFRDTLIGQWKAFLSAIEAVQIALFKEFQPDMESFLTNSTQWLRENREEIIEWAKEIKKFLGDITTFMKDHPDLIKYGLPALIIRGKVGAAIAVGGILEDITKQVKEKFADPILDMVEELIFGLETSQLPTGFFRGPIDEAELYKLRLGDIEADVDHFTKMLEKKGKEQGDTTKTLSKEALEIQQQMVDGIKELTLSEMKYKIWAINEGAKAAKKASVDEMLIREWRYRQIMSLYHKQIAERTALFEKHEEEHQEFMRMQGLNEYEIIAERGRMEIENLKKKNVELIKNTNASEKEISKIKEKESKRIAAIQIRIQDDLNKRRRQQLAMVLSSTTQHFRTIAEAGGTYSETAFKMYKAFAIAETIINTYKAAAGAYAALASIPYVGPALGAAAAAVAIAAGLSQLSMIKAQKMPSYDQGGISTTPGMYYAGVPEAHVPLEGGKVIPVRIIKDEEEEEFVPPVIYMTVELDGRVLTDFIYDRTKSGDQVVHVRGVTEI